jgi:TorA maturation chaperone TorD
LRAIFYCLIVKHYNPALGGIKEGENMLSEHAEKCFTESKEAPAASLASHVMKKGSPTAQQDAQARADMYAFLAAVYLYPPTPDLIQRLTAGDFLEELCSLFGEETVTDLKTFAAKAHPDTDFDDLDQEYMNLFAVPTGRYVTPFEDVYQGQTVEGMLKRGPLMGERAIAARRIYRQAGADMDRACKELPTHIGVELSYMSFLCEREAAAIRDEEEQKPPDEEKRAVADSVRYRELQIKFLNEHLNAWFPQLSLAIKANAKSLFYRGMARITEAFLDYDTAGLSERSKVEINVGAEIISINP